MGRRNKVILAGVLALMITVPVTAFLGMKVQEGPAEAASSDEPGGDSADAKVDYVTMDLKTFLIPMINDGKTQNYLSARVKVQVRPGDPSVTDNRALVRDRVITRLYDLDNDFSLKNREDVQRIRGAVRGAVIDVFGRERVGRVLFSDLVQQDLAS